MLLRLAFSQMFPFGDETEILGGVIRTAEVYLPLFVMLYSFHILRLEDRLNLSELIVSKNRAIKLALNHKFLSLLTYSTLLAIAYYIGVSNTSFLGFMGIVLPPTCFYLAVVFFFRVFLNSSSVAFSLGAIIWMINLTFFQRHANILSTFPRPLYYFGTPPLLFNLNKVTILLIAVLLPLGFFSFTNKRDFARRELNYDS